MLLAINVLMDCWILNLNCCCSIEWTMYLHRCYLFRSLILCDFDVESEGYMVLLYCCAGVIDLYAWRGFVNGKWNLITHFEMDIA